MIDWGLVSICLFQIDWLVIGILRNVWNVHKGMGRRILAILELIVLHWNLTHQILLSPDLAGPVVVGNLRQRIQDVGLHVIEDLKGESYGVPDCGFGQLHLSSNHGGAADDY